jgi:hypothetical protein
MNEDIIVYLIYFEIMYCYLYEHGHLAVHFLHYVFLI